MKTWLFAPIGVLIFFYAFSANAQNPVPCEAPYPQVQNLQTTVEGQSVELTWDAIIGSLGFSYVILSEPRCLVIIEQMVLPSVASKTNQLPAAH